MKFGKKLQHQLDHSLPEWKPNFLCYKQLKKRLKQLGSTAPMAFLTAAILDENPSLEDEFLIPVTEELANGGDSDRGLKRRPDGSVLFEERKKRKGSLLFKEDVIEDLEEAQEPEVSSVEQEQTKTLERTRHPTEKDDNFLRLVKTELHKFNAFFLEKEEEFLIRLDILERRTEDVREKRIQSGGVFDRSTYEELIQVHRQIVTLHGEMVLLMNYSSLNYIGLLKILKKYDKHTGANLRQTVHGSVLQQPFFSTANLKELVGRCLECENSLQSIFPTPDVEVVEPVSGSLSSSGPSIDDVESEPIPRHVRAALRTMQDIR